jgi:myo-inositol-1(or 4)-monophosphatase
MNTIDYTEALEVAKTLAIGAGEIVRNERKANTYKKEYKDNIELVTSADIAADKYITDGIKKNYPYHKIFSEEMYSFISLEDLRSNYVWIVDPIDGTLNYANNHLQVAISIALSVNGEVVAGVVYSPFQDEMFYASKGGGAFLNDQKIQVAEGVLIKHALIGTGFSYKKQERVKQIEYLTKILEHCQDIRRIGAAALDLCYVAIGRLAGYYESIKSWDMAAGTLIAREAGARVGYLNGVPKGVPCDLYGEGLVVASPDIYEELMKILKS